MPFYCDKESFFFTYSQNLPFCYMTIASHSPIVYLHKEVGFIFSVTSSYVPEGSYFSHTPLLKHKGVHFTQPFFVRGSNLWPSSGPPLNLLCYQQLSFTRGLKLNVVFQMLSNKCRIKRNNHFPLFTRYAFVDTVKYTDGLQCGGSMLLTHVFLAVP